jgi:hypothetical protein
MLSRKMARALRRVWQPKDEAGSREACLNKPSMVMVPPKGDTCPVNNLPPELLSRIFELGGTDSHGACQVKNGLGNGHVLPDLIGIIFPGQIGTSSKGLTVDESFDTSSSFRISVSLVSRYWHNVAISTPSLWTTITCPSLPCAYPPNVHLSLLLKRSNGLPIDIDLGRGCQPDAYPLLVSHVHHWHSVKAEFHSSEGVDAFLHAVSHPSVPAASQLTTLQLSFRPHEDFQLGQFTLFCGSAPYLERLTLWGVHVDWNQAWISSASNLTYLQLGFHADNVHPSWVQLATILCGTPALETLKLHTSALGAAEWPIMSDAGTAAENPIPPIQLLKLTDFSIALLSHCATGLFRVLYMPSLTSLTLDLWNTPDIHFIRCLAGPPTSLAPPSHDETPLSLLSQLENLNIVCFLCSRPWIELLYEELQNLKSLSIALRRLWDRSPLFFEALLFPCRLPGRSVWLPLLETVYVSQYRHGFQLISNLVQKRKDFGVPLKSLYLEQSCRIYLKDEDLTWFKENVETFDYF